MNCWNAQWSEKWLLRTWSWALHSSISVGWPSVIINITMPLCQNIMYLLQSKTSIMVIRVIRNFPTPHYNNDVTSRPSVMQTYIVRTWRHLNCIRQILLSQSTKKHVFTPPLQKKKTCQTTPGAIVGWGPCSGAQWWHHPADPRIVQSPSHRHSTLTCWATHFTSAFSKTPSCYFWEGPKPWLLHLKYI